MKKKESLNLPLKRVETPQPGIFYEVPHLSGTKKPASIPADYLRGRLDYTTEQLRQRIDIRTSKHYAKNRECAHKRVSELRAKILRAINTHANDGINSKAELTTFCSDVQTAIDDFKGQHEDTLHITQRFTEMFLKLERTAISDVFDLPNGSKEKEDTEEEIQLKKLLEESAKLVEMAKVPQQQIILIREKIAEAEKEYDQISKDTTAVKIMLEYLPDVEKLSEFPTAVREGINQEFERLINYQKRHDARDEICKSVEKSARDMAGEIAIVNGGYSYLSTLAKLRSTPALEEGLHKLSENFKSVDAAASKIQQLNQALTQLKEAQERIETIPDFADVLLKIGEEYGFGDEITLSTPPESSKNTTEASENEADETSERPVKRDKRPEPEISKSFRWNSVSKTEAAEEARYRLTSFNPLIEVLVTEERWHDLRLVLDRMTLLDIRACKLSQTVTGFDKAKFPKKEDLFNACFPQCYKNDDLTSLPGEVERGKQAKRFRWNKEGRDYTEIQNEVRSRLFAAWPFMGELYSQERWIELRFLLDRMTTTTLGECRISQAAYNAKNAPYDSYNEMLEDAFEQAYQDQA